jgi:4-hydroxy-2-oxoheptanedioate aldolase
MAELLGLEDPDFVIIDAQHGLFGHGSVIECLMALARTQVTPIVRVPSCDESYIGQVLDAGAHGVIVPMVESKESAERAAAACRIYPEGRRSFGPVRAAQSFGRDPKSLSDEVLCLVMVETSTAVDCIDEICAVPGVDGVFIGPGDLAITYGLAPGFEPLPGRHAEAIERVRTVCRANDVRVGLPCLNADAARRMIDQGFDYVTVGADTHWVSGGARSELARLRIDVRSS